MEINFKVEGVDNLLKTLDAKKVVTASKRAIIRAANSGRTVVSSQVRDKFNISKADLDKKIKVDLRNVNNLQAEVVIGGEPISMTKFKPQQTIRGVKSFIKQGLAQKKVKGKDSGGVKVSILKGRPALLKHAFMQVGRGNVSLVFRRLKGTKSSVTGREKLAALKVVSYPSIVKQPFNLQSIVAKITTTLKERLNHEISRLFKK